MSGQIIKQDAHAFVFKSEGIPFPDIAQKESTRKIKMGFIFMESITKS